MTHQYIQARSDSYALLMDTPPGTFSFRRNVVVGSVQRINIPIDILIQPHHPYPNRPPIFIEDKSAGDLLRLTIRH